MEQDPRERLIYVVHRRLGHYCKTPDPNFVQNTIERILDGKKYLPLPSCKFIKENAEAAFTKLHIAMEPFISKKSLEDFKKYMNYMTLIEIKEKFEETLDKMPKKEKNKECEEYMKSMIKLRMESHTAIMAELIKTNKHKLLPVDRVANLVSWLIDFYTTRKDLIKPLSKQLFLFLQDLLITLLVLECLQTMGAVCTYKWQIDDPQRVATFKITPHMVSPESDLFQSLILKEMIRILGLDIAQNESPEDLAKVILEYFKPRQCGWSKKGVDGVLKVVKDQSRYMALRSSLKHFVVSKIRCLEDALLAKLTKEDIEIEYIKNIMEFLTQLKQKKKPFLRSIRYEHPTCIAANEVTNINHIHHKILNEVTVDMLKEGTHPKINPKNGWVDVDNYLDFLIKIARDAVTVIPRSDTRKTLEYKHKKIATALQDVIALRTYVSDIEGTIEINKVALYHQKILFVLVAFRALLMYILPITPTNVQQVAKVFPNYAKELTLLIQPTSKKNSIRTRTAIVYYFIIMLFCALLLNFFFSP